MFTKLYAKISVFFTTKWLYFLYVIYCQFIDKNVTIEIDKNSKTANNM